MTDHFDALETRPPHQREQALFAALRALLTDALNDIPALGRWLGDVDPAALTNREALSRLPVMRKSDLMALQDADPPLGGLAHPKALTANRIFMSPGPVFEPQGLGADPWAAARALHAAGFRKGDIVHNAFSYHMTPGAFILEEGARALGCLVFAAGVGNTDGQVDAAHRLHPAGYTGTPDFLKVMLERADEAGKDLSSIRRALVSGGALFASLRAFYRERGIAVLQAYATADIGVIAYESADADGNAHEGMLVNESVIVEIVRPGTPDPVPDGEVGEVVVTPLNPAYPLVRFGTGDLSAIVEGPSPCGRTAMRIAGWMGRADQRTKVKGLFVDPKQIAAVTARHPEIARARLVVGRAGEQDDMELKVEIRPGASLDVEAVGLTLSEVTGLKGRIGLVEPAGLPNDGKVIADERDYQP